MYSLLTCGSASIKYTCLKRLKKNTFRFIAQSVNTRHRFRGIRLPLSSLLCLFQSLLTPDAECRSWKLSPLQRVFHQTLLPSFSRFSDFWQRLFPSPFFPHLNDFMISRFVMISINCENSFFAARSFRAVHRVSESYRCQISFILQTFYRRY